MTVPLRSRSPVRLIINADDLGRSREVNDAIADLFGEGMITSATLMANAPFLEDAIRKIPAGFRRALGVHLNVTEFQPLTVHPGWQEWVDDKGCFSLQAFRTKPLSSRLKEAITPSGRRKSTGCGPWAWKSATLIPTTMFIWT